MFANVRLRSFSRFSRPSPTPERLLTSGEFCDSSLPPFSSKSTVRPCRPFFLSQAIRSAAPASSRGRRIHFPSAARAAERPAIRPKVSAAAIPFPPIRFAPCTFPTTSPAAKSPVRTLPLRSSTSPSGVMRTPPSVEWILRYTGAAQKGGVTILRQTTRPHFPVCFSTSSLKASTVRQRASAGSPVLRARSSSVSARKASPVCSPR